MNAKPLMLVLGAGLIFSTAALFQQVLVAQEAPPAVTTPAAPAPAPVPAEAAAISALVAQLQQQQAQMVTNQTAIEQKMAELAENVRQARIFARRGGGGGTP